MSRTTRDLWYGYGAVICAIALVGCGGSDDTSESPQAKTAQQLCEELNGTQVEAAAIALPTKGATVTTATFKVSTSTMPEHCLVSGTINSVDPAAEPITYNVALPSTWNKRMVQLGGGGWDGFIPDVTTHSTSFASGPSPLARGYATYGSDSGHAAKAGVNAAAFTLNDEMLRNFTGEQIKKTHDLAVRLIKQRYGQQAEKSYFEGGSEGGREALVAVQRYPADYDGVVSLFPAQNWSALFMKFNAVGAAMRKNGGAGWLNPTKAVLLRDAAISACDTLDGAADGLISNARACTFDPVSIRCPGGSDTGNTCLSDAQISSVRVMTTPLSFPYGLANNVTSIGPYYPGTDFGTSFGTSASFNLADVQAGTGVSSIGAIHNFGDSFVRYAVMRDPNADTLNFDPTAPGAYLQRLKEVSNLFDTTNTNIDPFLARGGKLILLHGWADQLVHIAGTNAYYEGLVAGYGQAKLDQSVRYYTIPGYAHTGGLFAADNGMPSFDALEAWVERGVAPGELVVSDVTVGHVNRTRPLCIYPAWPKYKGTGNLNIASSYSCVKE